MIGTPWVIPLLSLCAPAAQPQDVQAVLEGPTGRIEVGQPIECRLVVEHPREARAALAGDGFALDEESWLMLEQRGVKTLPDPADPERAITTYAWLLCSLEPGQREIEGPFVEIESEGGGKIIQVKALGLDVRGLLFPEEDAARELVGISGTLPAARSAALWPWILAGVVLAALLVVALVRRRARRPSSAPGPSASVRLAAIEGRPLDSPEAVQEAFYLVSHLLRGEYDRALGRDLAGLTDEEWLAASGEALSRLGQGEEQRACLQELLHTCGEVKYGQTRPTHWAVSETIRRAQDLAQQLDSTKDQGKQVAA